MQHTAMNFTLLLTIFLTLLLAATPISGGRVLDTRRVAPYEFEMVIIMNFGEETTPSSQLVPVKKKPSSPPPPTPEMDTPAQPLTVEKKKPYPVSPPKMDPPPAQLIMMVEKEKPYPAVSQAPNMDTPPSQLLMVEKEKPYPYLLAPEMNPPITHLTLQQQRDIIIRQALRRLRGGSSSRSSS